MHEYVRSIMKYISLKTLFQFFQQIIPDPLKILYYKKRGRLPWSHGYYTYKKRFIKSMLTRGDILKLFQEQSPLPTNYGYALDVRVVEHPWIVAKMEGTLPGSLLDAGSGLNYNYIISHEAFRNKKITIINLHPEEDCFADKGISYVLGDLRALPFKDEYFDYIISISTFQHIGMDNTINYIKDNHFKEQNFNDFEKALLELKRVLKTEGKLFMTFPFGKYQNFIWFQQFDSERVQHMISCFDPSHHLMTFFKYTKNGWNVANQASCENLEYFDYKTTKYFNHKNTRGFDEDSAAASRAVCCLEIVK